MVTFNSDYPSLSLTTTPSHLHFVESYDGMHGPIIPKYASSLDVGMQMPRIDGKGFTIKSTTLSTHPGMWVLSTEACSAYANGILTTTNCLDEKKVAALSLLRVDALKHLDFDGDGKIGKPELVARLRSSFLEPSSRGQLHGGRQMHFEDHISDFLQADKDGDGAVEIMHEWHGNLTEEIFTEITQSDETPGGLRARTGAEQKFLFAWLKNSYDNAVSQCDADKDGKITQSEYLDCMGHADPAIQEAHFDRLADHIMGLLDTDGNDILDVLELHDEYVK